MTSQAAMIELLARVGANDGAAVLVSEHELMQWPGAAVAAMKRQSLLLKAPAAKSAVCPECEDECLMQVHVVPRGDEPPTAYIVCDTRDDVGRVEVSLDRLQQWQCSPEMVCAFVAASLGLRQTDKRRPASADFLEIGMANGDKRTQMLGLQTDGELLLVAGTGKLPLADLIEHHDGAYSLDGARVRQLVDAATTADSRYTPGNARREARKLDTQAMYAGWQKAYRELKKKRKDMPDTWYAQQIAKQPVAGGRDADTIRKHMKP
jgi:hypothetical protein